MAEKHSFLVNKGETFTLTIKDLKDSAGNEVSLAGHTITMTFKNKDGQVLETYSVPVVSTPVSIKVPVDEVETWPLGNNKYVLKDDQPNGDIRIFAYGSITVQEVD